MGTSPPAPADAPAAWLQRLRFHALSRRQRPAAPADYHIHGWRWHHVSVVGHLRQLHSQLHVHSASLCPAPGAPTSGDDLRRRALAAVQYIVSDNLRIHNAVQTSLLFPWVRARAPGEATALDVLAAETVRITADADALAVAVSRWRGGQACSRDLAVIRRDVRRVADELDRLFDVAERCVIPLVISSADVSAQRAFNDKVLQYLPSRDVRVAAVAFKSGVDVHGSDTDRHNLRTAVPAVVRNVAIPYWNSKLVGDRASFLTMPSPIAASSPAADR